jgi:hypothetical protein
MYKEAKDAEDNLRSIIDYHMTIEDCRRRIAEASSDENDDADEDVTPDTPETDEIPDFEEVDFDEDDGDPFEEE